MENRTVKLTALCLLKFKVVVFFFKPGTSSVLFPHCVQAQERKAPKNSVHLGD